MNLSVSKNWDLVPPTPYSLLQMCLRSSKVIYHPTSGTIWKTCSTWGLLNSKISWKKEKKVQCKHQWSFHSENSLSGFKSANCHTRNCCLEYSLLPPQSRHFSVPLSKDLPVTLCLTLRSISLTQRLRKALLFLFLPPLWPYLMGPGNSSQVLNALSLRQHQAQ